MAHVFQALLDNSDYALSKRQTTARNKQLYDDFGPYFSTIITRMLRLEVIAVGKDPLMHMRPQDVSPQLCEEFNLQKYEKLYLEKAPIFFGLLRILCCVDTSMQPLRMQPIGEPLTPEELEEEMEKPWITEKVQPNPIWWRPTRKTIRFQEMISASIRNTFHMGRNVSQGLRE